VAATAGDGPVPQAIPVEARSAKAFINRTPARLDSIDLAAG
jgi:hypothetical protein